MRRRVLSSLLAGLVAAGAVSSPGAVAIAQSNIQYDYDSLGRLCRARYLSGRVINYEYDANNNRKAVTTTLSGGVTNSAACPNVTGVAGTASAARPRNNKAPTVPTSIAAKMCWQMHVISWYGASDQACVEREVNILRYAFDADFNELEILSASIASGPGSVRVDTDKKSIWVTPPASGPENVQTTISYTVKDSAGATATGSLVVTYYTVTTYFFV
jgi:hypothetical protein